MKRNILLDSNILMIAIKDSEAMNASNSSNC